MSWDKLRQNIDTYFSLEEIKTLCFDLGIDYESLGGEGKVAKIRELISLCRRTNRVPELIAYLAPLRPHVKWNELLLEDDPVSSPPPPKQPQPTVQPSPPLPVITTPPPEESSQEPVQTASTAPQRSTGSSQPATGWRNWGDHPVVVALVVIGTIIGIIVGVQQIMGQTSSASTPTGVVASSAITSGPAATSTTPPSTPVPTEVSRPDTGATANAVAAETATAIFVAEGTRAAATATAADAQPADTSVPAVAVIVHSEGFCRKGVAIHPEQGLVIARQQAGLSAAEAGNIPSGNDLAIDCNNIEVSRSGMQWVRVSAIVPERGEIIGWIPTNNISLSYCGTKRAIKSDILIRIVPGKSETHFERQLEEGETVQFVCDSEVKVDNLFWTQILLEGPDNLKIVGWVPSQDIN